MPRPAAREQVALRKPNALFPKGTQWKVTARYELHLTATKRVSCVRVACYTGSGNFVQHFSQAEFSRLFKKGE